MFLGSAVRVDGSTYIAVEFLNMLLLPAVFTLARWNLQLLLLKEAANGLWGDAKVAVHL